MSTTYPPETNNGKVTAWIPLTTGWTEVSRCSFRYMRYIIPITTQEARIISDKSIFTDFTTKITAFVAYDPVWGVKRPDFPLCVPDEITSWHHGYRNNISDGPHLISLLPLRCPDAWWTVATFVKSGISTQAMCCPS